MNRLTRAFAVVVAAGLVVPVWASPALAESANDVPAAAAYFNSAGVAQPEQSPSKPPNPIASVDGVAPGNLGVAAQGTREDKTSFLYFSLSTVPIDASITSATLTVPLAPADNANVRLNATPDKVLACAIEGSAFTNDDDGEALSRAPERKCEVAQSPGTGDDTAYVFDVTAHVSDWLATTNDGLALRNDPLKSDSFQVVFTKEATLAVEYTAVSTTDTTTTTTDLGATSSFPTTTDTGTTSTGTTGFDSGSVTAEIPTSSFDTATAAPLTGALPAAPAPETAGAEPVIADRVAASGPIEVLSPTPAFWIALLLLAGVLGFLGLVMGDRTAPLTGANSRPSRLTRALSAPAGSRPSLLTSRSS